MGYATPIDISDEDMLYSVLTRPIPPKTEYAKQRPATTSFGNVTNVQQETARER